jgi:tetratricopeptide (TPR) repeat protein
MHILLSDKRYTYQPKFRFIKPKDQQKVKVKLANNLILTLGYRYKEQLNYFSMAAEAAFMTLNPLDRQNNQFFVELNLHCDNQEAINLQEESTSVGLGYSLGVALAYRNHLQKHSPLIEHIFATGEVSSSGNVHAVGHINEKLMGVLHAMKKHPEQAFIVFIPKGNDKEVIPTLIEQIVSCGGSVCSIEHISQAIQALLSHDFDGSVAAEALTFKGLCSFSPYDAFYFFGREKQIADLHALYNDRPSLIKVHGVSGSGKSSLIKAGLFPILLKEQPNLKWHIAAPKQFANSHELLSGFISSKEAGFSVILSMLDIPIAQFVDKLLQLDTTYLDEISAHLSAHKTPYVWFIDQFEELYDSDINSTLLQSLALLGDITPITVLISIRSEYLHFTDMIGHDFYVSHSLSASSWINIIENQSIALGLTLEPGLAQTIQTEALKLSHGLPAVEYLLTQMHGLAIKTDQPKQLTYSQYRQLNKLTGVIYKQAETILSQHEQLTEQFFELFIGVNLNGNSYAKHVDFMLLMQNYPHLKALINELIEKQLIIRHQVHRSPPYLKLTHDCLITIAEDLSLDQQIWPRFYIWLNDRKSYLQWFHGIEAKFILWKQCLGSDQEKQQYELSKYELREGTKYLGQPGTICLQEVRDYIMRSQQGYQFSLEQKNTSQKRQLISTGILFCIAFSSAIFAYVQKQQIQKEQLKAANALSSLKETILVNIDSLEPLITQYLPTYQRKYLNQHLATLISSIEDLPLADVDKLRLLLIQIKTLRQDDSSQVDTIKKALNTVQTKLSVFAASTPKDTSHKKVAIEFNYQLGALLLKHGEPQKAQDYFEKAITLADMFTEKSDNLTLLTIEVATKLAIISLDSGNVVPARAELHTLLTRLNSLTLPQRFEQNINNLKVDILRNLALASDSNSQATPLLLQAKSILERQLHNDPNHLNLKYNLLRTYINLAELDSNKAASNSYYENAHALADTYSIKDPDNIHVQVAQLLLATRLSKRFISSNQMNTAHSYLISGMEIATKLKRLDTSNIDWLGHTAELYTTYAEYYAKTNAPSMSAKNYILAIDTAKQLVVKNEQNLHFANLLQGIYSKYANHLYNVNQKQKAIEYFEKAKEISSILIKKQPKNIQYKASHRKKLFNLGYIAAELNQKNVACHYFLTGEELTGDYINLTPSPEWLTAHNKFKHQLKTLKCAKT